jgi:DNA adenine methylase
MATLISQINPGSDASIVNVASVRQISPFRYPGGKTWLVPTISAWLRHRQIRPSLVVDPFVGGGSVPLGILAEGLTDRVVIGEIDPNVSAVWQCALSSQSNQLCARIETFQISRQNVLAELERTPQSSLERAFQTILRNRTFRGGILARGASLMKDGENGRGVASRWYPHTLVRRFRLLTTLSPFMEFYEIDAFHLIARYLAQRDVVFFIDPPYTAGDGKRAGKRLYEHNELDHEALFQLVGQAAGLVVMTYDDCPEVVEMANRQGFLIERIPMKNTHHEKKYELLISNSARVA